MNCRITLILLILASAVGAHTITLKEGEPPPKNSSDSELRKHAKQIQGWQQWLNTSIGDILHEFKVYADPKGRFMVGWMMENNQLKKVFFMRGITKVDVDKVEWIVLPKDAVVVIDFSTGDFSIKGNLAKKQEIQQDAPVKP